MATAFSTAPVTEVIVPGTTTLTLTETERATLMAMVGKVWTGDESGLSSLIRDDAVAIFDALSEAGVEWHSAEVKEARKNVPLIEIREYAEDAQREARQATEQFKREAESLRAEVARLKALVPATTPDSLDALVRDDEAFRFLVEGGRKIHAIKRLRVLTTSSLVDAKNAVERVAEQDGWGRYNFGDNFEAAYHTYLANGGKYIFEDDWIENGRPER